MRQIFCALLIFGLTSCFEEDDRIRLVNKTDQTFYYKRSIHGKFYTHPINLNILGDTMWKSSNRILPNEEIRFKTLGKNGWADTTKRVYFNIFLFSEELLKSTEHELLVENQLYTKKLDHKVIDLKESNWTIYIE